MRPTRTSTFLRNNWLLILLIVVGLLWWRIFDLFTPSDLGFWPHLKNVNYWSIVTNTNIYWIALLRFIGLWVFIIVRVIDIKYLLLLIVPSMLLCILSTCTSSTFSFGGDWGSIEHVMSVEYQHKTYHLAFYKYTRFMNTGSSSFYVFKCDITGHICTSIFDEVGSRDNPSGLMVKDDKLVFEYSGHEFTISPEETDAG